jgi:hypothetical protein
MDRGNRLLKLLRQMYMYYPGCAIDSMDLCNASSDPDKGMDDSLQTE